MRQIVQDFAGILILLFTPGLYCRIIPVFQPAIGVFNGGSMKGVGHHPDVSNRGQSFMGATLNNYNDANADKNEIQSCYKKAEIFHVSILRFFCKRKYL
jgi:hypothetical protein